MVGELRISLQKWCLHGLPNDIGRELKED
jgi:hypothetical protein